MHGLEHALNLRKYAKGQDCKVRLPCVCNFNTETTVLAHVKHGWYGSLKPPDILGVHACSACHDVIDGRVHIPGLTAMEVDLAVFRALCEQLAFYVDRKILKW